jgi:hypothetical protein
MLPVPTFQQLEAMTIPDLRTTAIKHGLPIPAAVRLKTEIFDHVAGGLGYVLDARAPPPRQPTEVQLTMMTVSDLRAAAAAHGIKIPSAVKLRHDIFAYVARAFGYDKGTDSDDEEEEEEKEKKVPAHPDPAAGNHKPSLDELEHMRVVDLRAAAAAHGIKIPSAMKLRHDIFAYVARAFGYDKGTDSDEEEEVPRTAT